MVGLTFPFPHHLALTRRSDFADGDRKMILGFIWFLIINVSMAGLQGDQGGQVRDDGAKKALLEWCRKRLAPYKLPMDNFTTW